MRLRLAPNYLLTTAGARWEGSRLRYGSHVQAVHLFHRHSNDDDTILPLIVARELSPASTGYDLIKL